jgi:ABC-2 type transport system permease protein
MIGSIFVEQIRRSWRAMLYWGAGIGFLFFYVMAVIQDVEIINQYQRLMETMPPALLSVFGMTEVSLLATPDGFVAFGITYGALCLAVYAVLSGLSISANDEDEGILDVVLSLPVSRRRVLVERFLAFTVMAIGITLISYVGILLGRMAVPPEVSFDLGRLLIGTLNMIPITIAIMAITMMFASLIAQKRMVSAIAGLFVIASYFIFTLGNAVSSTFTDVLIRLSVFTYFDGEQTVATGIRMDDAAILLGVAIAALIGSIMAFERRDISL